MTDVSTRNQMGRGILFSLQSRMVFVFGAYALHIVLARRLGPDEYGAFGVCLSIITICYIFLSNGVRQILSRRTSRTPDGAGSILRHGLAAQSILSLALGACVTGLAHPLAALLRDPDLRLPLIFSGLVVATQGSFFVYIGIFNGLKRFAAETSVHSFYGLLRPAAAVAFVALGWGVTGGVAGLLLASVAAVLLGAWLARGISSGRTSDLRIGGILREAAPVMIIFGAATALMNLDVLIVKRLVPVGEETGYYAAASAVAKILYWFLAAFANVLIPFISRSHKAVDLKAAAGAVGGVLRRSALLALPAALLAGLYAEQIIVLVYGGEYRPAAAALRILVWGMTALGLVSILTAGFIGIGGEKKLIIPSLTGIAAVTALGFRLVPRYGIAGGALAMTAASLLVLGAAAILLQRRLPFLPSPLPWLRLALSLGAAAAAGYWMRAWGAHFLIKAGLLLAVYFLGLALTGELRRGDLEAVRNLFARPETWKMAPPRSNKIDKNKIIRKYLIFILIILFICLRIWVIFKFQQTDFKGSDALSYISYATAIQKDNSWFFNPNFFGEFRAPGYPFMIACIESLFGQNQYLAVYLFQALLSILTCVFIFRLAKSMFDERIAGLAFFWSGIYLNYLRYPGRIGRESLVIFLVAMFFYYFHRYLKSRDRFPGVLWGAVAAYVYLIHTDARFLFHLPFLILLFFFEVPFKQAFAKGLRLGLPILLLMVPWTIRNYAAYDSFVLINTRTLDLRPKTARNPTADNRFQYNIAHFRRIEQTRQPRYPSEEERALIKSGLNPTQRSPEEVDAIRRDVYPARSYLHRKWVWFLELWRPVRFSTYYFPFPDARFQGKWSLRHNVAGILLYGWLLPALLAAFVLLYRKRDKNGLFLFLPLFAHSLLHVLQWGRERYRIPLDLLVLIGGFYAVGELIRYRRARRARDIG